MTTLANVLQRKLVSQMMIRNDHNKLENFTCLNECRCNSKFFDSKTTPISELKKDKMKKLFLTTGQMRMITFKRTAFNSCYNSIHALIISPLSVNCAWNDYI